MVTFSTVGKDVPSFPLHQHLHLICKKKHSPDNSIAMHEDSEKAPGPLSMSSNSLNRRDASDRWDETALTSCSASYPLTCMTRSNGTELMSGATSTYMIRFMHILYVNVTIPRCMQKLGQISIKVAHSSGGFCYMPHLTRTLDTHSKSTSSNRYRIM